MANRLVYLPEGPTKDLGRLIRKLGDKYSDWQVFEHFVEMTAITISNAVDWVHQEEREKRYLEIVKRYTKEELELFPKMYVLLAAALTDNLDDVLGAVFGALELSNKYKGQFFTPMHVCTMMGKISIVSDEESIKEKGYMPMCEPCCGSGAMIIGAAQGMKECGHDYQKQLLVLAQDVDLKCVHMCYVQLSLLSIPAIVIHGNTLAFEEISKWYTPAYMVDGWIFRS